MSGTPGRGRVAVRGGSHLRRGRGVRRASAGLSLVRVGAAAVILGAGLAVARLGDAAAFPVARVSIAGAELTDATRVGAALEVDGAPGNVFLYDTVAASERLGRLPTIRSAEVRAVLPDGLAVTLLERHPVLLWATGDDAGLLVDETGRFLATGTVGAAAVPVLYDRRPAAAGLAVGGQLPSVELRVARQLTGLTPTALGSTASALFVSVDDAEGFTVAAEPDGWRAVFGVYGEVTRSPDLVPIQVECLASLLADRPAEGLVRVVLSPEGQLCGTYSAPGGA